MQNKTCIVSVAFRDQYVRHQAKQIEALEADKAIVDTLYFTDKLPMKGIVYEDDIVSHFQKSLYGFKPHAIQHAINKGYKKIIWFDPAVMPTCSVQVLIDSLDTHPMIVRKGDTPILKMCNKKAKEWFGLSDEDLKDINHIGGTVYGFNFNNIETRHIFERWKQAEEAGIFGTQDEFMAGHWADEACMVLAMAECGLEQYWEEGFTYKNQKT